MSDPRSLFASPESPSSAAPPLPSGQGGTASIPASGSTSSTALPLPSGEGGSSRPSKTYLKFLVPNAVAGSIIGADGTTIGDIRARSGADIHISSVDVVFPGTHDRVVMVSGKPNNVIGAMAILLEEMLQEKKGVPQVKLAVHKRYCGGIIGHRGAKVKSLIATSLADIHISPDDGNQERLVTITGDFYAQLKAMELILEELIKDVNYRPNLTNPFPYGVVPAQRHGAPRSYGAPQTHGPHVAFQNYRAPQLGPILFLQNQFSCTISVDEAMMGFLVGYHGSNIKKIMQLSCANITISENSVPMGVSFDRSVTITSGTKAGVETALTMILNAVSSVAGQGLR